MSDEDAKPAGGGESQPRPEQARLPLLAPLTDDQRQLIDIVSRVWLSHGRWPIQRYVEHEMDRHGWAKVPSATGLSAAAQSRALRALVGTSIRVTPVVVAWADTERVATETGGVTYVGGEAVDQWLLAIPRVLSPDTVTRLAAAVGN